MHSHSNAEDFHNALTIHIHGPNFTLDKTPKKRKYFNIPTIKVYDQMIT